MNRHFSKEDTQAHEKKAQHHLDIKEMQIKTTVR